ncbi:MAG TPA: hypothetical protein VLL98_00020 [Rickettsiales bacterium]|nr:hypothetical protein [Rickettsiales bacterium]
MIKQKTKLLKREFADLLGCLPIVVSRLIKKGEVKVDVNGRIDIASPEIQQYIKDKRLEIQQHKDRITKRELKIEKEKQSESKTETKNKKTISKANKPTTKNESNKSSKDNPNFSTIEYETKRHKLDSEKYKAELLEMEVRQRKRDLINTELLNRIISKTIGNLAKNIVEIPINIVDELIDITKTEDEPKPLIINLITKSLQKEIEATVNKAEKEFLKL